MDATRSSVTLEELKIFHENDRAIYSILVSNFWRNPSECLQITSLWLWLEHVGFSNLMSKIYSVSQYSMNELADEAAICLKCVFDARFRFSAEGREIPLIRSLMAKEISLKFFHDNRLIALIEIERLATEVYTPVLADIMAKAVMDDERDSLFQNHMIISGNALQSSSMNQMMASSSFDESLMLSSSQLRIGGDVSQSRTQINEVPREERSRLNEIARQDRTMFATFSRGYPVSESEIRQFFSRILGNCIESIYMQEVMPDEQALYAIIVLLRPSFIRAILNGQTKAKFAVNGKHVWMRKFVPKNGRSFLRPPTRTSTFSVFFLY
ncbi:hypothetical protein Adt_33276 [Abeliophyllum distichum]|uniref:RGS domain-containing protein n=1 Tax=Abeliophyllum distichum TaxID=126358 RepID=A0ABD1QVS2_9LAMI